MTYENAWAGGLLAAALVAGLLLSPTPLDAQPANTATEATPGEDSDAPGKADYEAALRASEAREYDRALELLERAYIAEKNPLYLYQRILVLEAMEEHQLALQLLQSNRDALSRHPEINELVVIEQRLENAIATADTTATGQSTEMTVVETDRADTGPNVLGWSLVGGGIVAAGTGIGLIVLGENELEQLRCMPGPQNPDPAGCEGVDAYENLSQQEFEDKTDSANTLKVIGYGTGAVGLGLLGWGVYELLTTEESVPTTSWYVAPAGRAGAAAGFSLKF